MSESDLPAVLVGSGRRLFAAVGGREHLRSVRSTPSTHLLHRVVR